MKIGTNLRAQGRQQEEMKWKLVKLRKQDEKNKAGTTINAYWNSYKWKETIFKKGTLKTEMKKVSKMKWKQSAEKIGKNPWTKTCQCMLVGIPKEEKWKIWTEPRLKQHLQNLYGERSSEHLWVCKCVWQVCHFRVPGYFLAGYLGMLVVGSSEPDVCLT